MSEILCITNRKLCKEDFLTRVDRIAQAHPAGIVLREKDLSEEQYRELAERVMEICARNRVRCILHSFVGAAAELSAEAFHAPLPVLREMQDTERKHFKVLGASCHSVPDALEAVRLGCTYITAGHVFETDCKKGLPGRGISFLREVCRSVSVPVYAIGGISSENYGDVIRSGAFGACVMSGPMQCADVQAYLSGF